MVQGVEQIKRLVGPVYQIDNKHHFNEAEKGQQPPKALTGPVFAVDR